ncbi:MAG: YhbY family RNA-binding protein [Clostridia bacterium]|nr:YhbY family RNA-binding protein [Clostridia bacterium]
MISTKERATLRGYSNNIPDLVFVGKDGITENVVKQVLDNLTAHELIKIKVQQNCELTPREVCDQLVLTTSAEPISVVGSKIVLYKRTNKKGFKHYL